MRLRVLWVVPALPVRGVSGSREYLFELISRMAARHDVTVLALVDPEDDAPVSALPPGARAFHRVLKTPWHADDRLLLVPRAVHWGYTHPTLAQAVRDRLAAERFDLVHYDYTELGHIMATADVPSTLCVQQLWFAAERAVWRAEGGGMVRGLMALHRHLRDLDFELRAVARATRIVTLTREDGARIARFTGRLPETVPAGVDTERLRPGIVPAAASTDLLFVGHMKFIANTDALRFVVREVLPQIGRAVRFRVVGSAIGDEVRALVGSHAEVIPDAPDIRPHLAAARMVLAPVRIGTGVRIKVLEALAMARPVVTTTQGAEGIEATPGTHLLVADDGRGFARAIRELLDDPARGAALGVAGRAHVEARFAWDAIAARWDGLWREVVRDGGATGPLTGDPPAALRAIAGLGRWPGHAAGAVLLAARGVRWYARSLMRGVR